MFLVANRGRRTLTEPPTGGQTRSNPADRESDQERARTADGTFGSLDPPAAAALGYGDLQTA